MSGSLFEQTMPHQLPELLVNLSSQGPLPMGATLLLRAVYPGTIIMTEVVSLHPDYPTAKKNKRVFDVVQGCVGDRWCITKDARGTRDLDEREQVPLQG